MFSTHRILTDYKFNVFSGARRRKAIWIHITHNNYSIIIFLLSNQKQILSRITCISFWHYKNFHLQFDHHSFFEILYFTQWIENKMPKIHFQIIISLVYVKIFILILFKCDHYIKIRFNQHFLKHTNSFNVILFLLINIIFDLACWIVYKSFKSVSYRYHSSIPKVH